MEPEPEVCGKTIEDFPEIPKELLPYDDWFLVYAGGFFTKEAIHVLEARAIYQAMEWAAKFLKILKSVSGKPDLLPARPAFQELKL